MPSQSSSISLNILTPAQTKGQREGKVKRSGAAKWRALILFTVNAIIAARLAWWLANDQPPMVSPVEPSETLAFSKDNIINAGMIFFLLMIVSTMIFGRFFCGWACHFLAVQDAARWLLLKLGIRPRPLRSRLLGLVPLGAFLYMFIWPLAYRAWLFVGNVRLRLSAGDSFDGAIAWANAQPFAFGPPATEIVRAGFWDTFPGVAVAIFSFAVAGGLIVYVLGAKGFCFYACPYGGIFGPVDKLAPFRIRVNEDCTQSGHCTSVCSSNVRVHEEVRDYGMVVDPGCMKCLDCVSVCPNDALRWGVGKPALFAKPRREPDIHHPHIFAFREELALAALFLITLYSIHSLYDVFPFLVSLGLSSMIAYLILVVAQTFYKPTVRALRVNLKLKGKLTRVGIVALPLAALLVAFIGHSAYIQHRLWRGTKLYDEHRLVRDAALTAGSINAITEDQQQDLRDTLAYINTTLKSTPGPLARQEIQQAWLLAALGQHERFAEEAEQAAGMFRNTRRYRLDVADALFRAGRFEDAEAFLTRILDADEDDADARAVLAELAAQNPNRQDEALEIARRAHRADPNNPQAALALARLIAITQRDIPAAIDTLAELAAAEGLTTQQITNVAIAMYELGAPDRALEFITSSAPKSENPVPSRLLAVDLYLATGQPDRATALVEELASDPDAESQLLQFAAEWFASRVGDLDKAYTYIEAADAKTPGQPGVLSLKGDILDARAITARNGGDSETAEALADDARAAYQRALERFTIERNTSPTDPRPLIGLAQIQLRTGDFDDAAQNARRATEVMPNNPNAWATLALSLESLGRAEEAAEAQRRAQSLAGQNP